MDVRRELDEEMSASPEVVKYLADRDIAIEFYGALCNMKWYVKPPLISEDEQIIKKLKGEEEVWWSCSWRSAGGIIADIRNLHYHTNECYMDFYCSGGEGKVTDLVRDCFDKMGWKLKLYDD